MFLGKLQTFRQQKGPVLVPSGLNRGPLSLSPAPDFRHLLPFPERPLSPPLSPAQPLSDQVGLGPAGAPLEMQVVTKPWVGGRMQSGKRGHFRSQYNPSGRKVGPSSCLPAPGTLSVNAESKSQT